MKLASLLLAPALLLSACGNSAKKPVEDPSKDVPQDVTCCMWMSDEGVDERKVVPVEQCPEDKRESVDACNIGPGDAEPVN